MFVLFLTVVIDLIGFGMIIPILPFAAPRFGASPLDIALLVVSYSVCGALVSPLWGRLSDRWGRKKTLLTCLAGTGFCYVLLGFASTLTGLYAVRILAGCFSGNFGVASAMAADMSTPQTRARAMGTVGAAFGLGMVVGPTLGGLLAGPEASLMRPAFVAAAMSLTAIILGAFLLRETVPSHRAPAGKSESMHALLARTGNTSLVAQFLAITGAISTISYLFPLAAGHFLNWGPHQVGIVFGIQGLAMAALQFGLTGPLVRRFGEMGLLRFALSAMIAGFCLAAAAHTEVLLLISFFVVVTGASCCTPVLNTLLSNRTPLHLRGRMMGTSSAASAWGRVFGPLVAGLALSGFGYGAAWLVGGLTVITVLVWTVRTRLQPASPEALVPVAKA